MDLAQLAEKIGNLIAKVEGLETHFTNHLHNHKWDRIFMTVQTLVIVGMFCFLKWGG